MRVWFEGGREEGKGGVGECVGVCMSPPVAYRPTGKGIEKGGREGGAAGAITYLQGHGRSGRPRAPGKRGWYRGGGEW